MNELEVKILEGLKDNPEGLDAWELKHLAKGSNIEVLNKMVKDGNIWKVKKSGSKSGVRYIYLSEPLAQPSFVENLPTPALEYGQAANNVMDNLARLIDENQNLRKCIQEIHDVTGRFLS